MKPFPVLILLGLAAGYAHSSLAQHNARDERDTLTALPAFRVIVEDLVDPAAFTAISVDKAQIRTDVELRLRAAKLPLSDTARAYLYVRPVITLIEDDRASPHARYAVTIDVAFRQPVRINANGKLWLASTWEEGTLGIGTRQALADKIRESIKDLVDRFINDALAVAGGVKLAPN